MVRVELPSSIIARVEDRGGPTAVRRIVEAAMNRVLDGTPGERMGMMQAALGLEESDPRELTCDVPEELVQQFADYCEQKRLRSDVLLTGALVAELDNEALLKLPTPPACLGIPHPAPSSSPETMHGQ